MTEKRDPDGHPLVALDARYLQALTELAPHHAHVLYGRLGTAALEIDLAMELLASDPPPPAKLERARTEIARAREVLREMTPALTTWLGLSREPGANPARYDLRDLLRELESVLIPATRDRRCSCRVVLPPREAVLSDPRSIVRKALVVAAIEVLGAVPQGGGLECALAIEGGLATARFAAAGAEGAPVPAHDFTGTCGILSAVLESNSGAACSRTPASLALTFQIQHSSD